jgi:hypothetical protein
LPVLHELLACHCGLPELYTAWHLVNAARIGPQVTLTKLEMIGF